MATAAPTAKRQRSPSGVRVVGLAGVTLVDISPAPPDVSTLKLNIEEAVGCPVELQRLVESGGARILVDGEQLPEGRAQLTLVVDETPLSTWDIAGNPCRDMLDGEGGTVSCPGLRTDYVNVLSRVPVRRGRHYFKFVMHAIGDEQWCGLARGWTVSSQAGSRLSGRELDAWTYYCGRVGDPTRSIVDGLGALHVNGSAITEFKKPRPEGDVIGMLVDMDIGRVAFDLNGDLQGVCEVMKEPLWVITHVDDPVDRVELQKPSLDQAPEASVKALNGPLLKTKGTPLDYSAWRWGSGSSSDEEEQQEESNREL